MVLVSNRTDVIFLTFSDRTMILNAMASTCHVMLGEDEYVCKKRPVVNSFSCKGEQVGLQQGEGTVQDA